MSRTLWFVAGAASTAYAFTKARRAAEALTPDGMRDRLAGLSLGVRLFGEELRAEKDAKESELRERLGLRPDGPTEIGAAAAQTLQLTRKGNT